VQNFSPLASELMEEFEVMDGHPHTPMDDNFSLLIPFHERQTIGFFLASPCSLHLLVEDKQVRLWFVESDLLGIISDQLFQGFLPWLERRNLDLNSPDWLKRSDFCLNRDYTIVVVETGFLISFQDSLYFFWHDPGSFVLSGPVVMSSSLLFSHGLNGSLFGGFVVGCGLTEKYWL